MSAWTIAGRKAAQSITPDGRLLDEAAIDGVIVHEVRHVPTDRGYLTELMQPEWFPPSNRAIAHVFQQTFDPGAVSAWNAHAHGTDRMFCVSGRILLALYDGRKDSSSAGRLAKYRIGTVRPALVVIPPGVWHGVKNIGTEPAILINMSDRAYSHADPDHWREPPDSPNIPFRF